MARVDAPRSRRSFARLENTLDLPNLIDIQKASFDSLVDPEKGGLRETIDDVSPIEDYTGNLAVVFEDITFDEPTASISECREKDLTYARPLTVKVAFQNRETGEIREQSVFMGDFPWMTDWGTFIINGTERVVVTQLVRSPGAYVMEPKDREKQVFIANLMPARGSWLELEIDKKGRVYVRIDRKRKLPVTVLLRALGYAEDEQILELFDNSIFIRNTIDADPEVTKTEEGALIELFKKQRPGEPPSVDNARALLQTLFFDSKRYDLTRVGRYKLNSRLHLDEDLDNRVLTHRDIIELIRELVTLPVDLGLPADGNFPDSEEPIKDFALEAQAIPRDAITDRLDEYEHFGNRRLRTVGRADPGGVPDRPLPHGAGRARAPHHRGRRHDHAPDDHQHPARRRGAQGVLRLVAAVAVPGPDQLPLGADPQAPAVRPRGGWSHARARADRGARRAPDPLRAHVPDRDAGGPEHRSDRLALLLRGGVRVRLRHHSLPQGEGRRRHRRDRPPRRQRGGREGDRPGERRGGPQDRQAQGADGRLPLARRRAHARVAEGGRPDGRVAEPDLVGGHGADPVPRARRREPCADGLEHAAPGGSTPQDRGPADRDRHGGARRDRHRRRAAWRRPTARCPTSTPRRIVVENGARRSRSTSSTSTCARTRAP